MENGSVEEVEEVRQNKTDDKGSANQSPKFLTPSVLFTACTILMLIVGYIVSVKFPMQDLKIRAVTKTEEADIFGTTDLYYFKSLGVGKTHKAVIKFMAVKNTSPNLFTSRGNGQYVYLGCSEMVAEHSFVTFGRFIHIRLTLNAAQTDLKLEDGSSFDITKYSLKPILVMEE